MQARSAETHGGATGAGDGQGRIRREEARRAKDAGMRGGGWRGRGSEAGVETTVVDARRGVQMVGGARIGRGIEGVFRMGWEKKGARLQSTPGAL